MNWTEFVQNPKAVAVKKFMVDVLEEKYSNYDDLTTRISRELITESDLNTFAKMINDVYEMGYKKAIDEYKDKLADFGIQVEIKQKKDDNQQ